MSADVLDKAVRITMRSERFFPNLATFMDTVIRVMGGELMAPDEAWAQVESARRAAPGTRMDLLHESVQQMVIDMEYSPFDVTADAQRLSSVQRTFRALWSIRRQKALDDALGGAVVSRPQMPAAGATERIADSQPSREQ